MSRYVSVTLDMLAVEREELLAALHELALPVEHAEHPDDRLLLAGSLECAGEPVDLRLAAGVLTTVEDWGFVREGARWRLVCGELDRRSLQAELIEPLTKALVLARGRRAAQAGVLDEQVEADGTRILRLRQS